MYRELVAQVGFTLVYAVCNGALHWGVLRVVQSAQPKCRSKPVVAFELASLIQFTCWAPLLLWKGVNPWFLFSIMNGRELYDVILFARDKDHSLPLWYKKFVATHHAISLSSRVVAVLLMGLLLGQECVRQAILCLFAYYICSVFLVAPVPLNRLYFDRMPTRVKIRANVLIYTLARVAHLSVVVYSMFVFNAIAGTVLRTIAWATILAGYLANEYPSAKSGLWKLRALTRPPQPEEGKRNARCHLGDTAST